MFFNEDVGRVISEEKPINQNLLPCFLQLITDPVPNECSLHHSRLMVHKYCYMI
jgi:hypothetical protein